MGSGGGNGGDRGNDEQGGNNHETSRNSHSHPKTSLSPIPPPSEWLNRYNQLLDRYPLRIKMITSFIVSGFGAALGSYLSTSAVDQLRTRKSRRMISNSTADISPTSGYGGTGSGDHGILSKIKWIDVLSYALHGGFINAPICHYWFEWLSFHGPSSDTASVLVDQLVVQPPLLVLMFVILDIFRANLKITLNLIKNGFKNEGVVTQALAKAGPAVVASWRFWPFVVYLTFKYLKKKHYTVALNLCSIAWTVYLSKGTSGDGGDAGSSGGDAIVGGVAVDDGKSL